MVIGGGGGGGERESWMRLQAVGETVLSVTATGGSSITTGIPC